MDGPGWLPISPSITKPIEQNPRIIYRQAKNKPMAKMLSFFLLIMFLANRKSSPLLPGVAAHAATKTMGE